MKKCRFLKPHIFVVHGVRDKLCFVIWLKSKIFFENGTLSINTT
jgi:hypothetical protein